MVKDKTFREDLYFRLDVVPILLPPLRNRKGDIRLLADFFLEKFSRQMNKKVKGFTPGAIAILETYPWPGNIRELENLVERMVVLGPENRLIEEKDLPFDLLFHKESMKGTGQDSSENQGLIQARHSFERLYILRALQSCRWNQTRAADLLGIHRNTLIQKMKTMNLGREKHTD
jgi:two-component system response regulator AtoC